MYHSVPSGSSFGRLKKYERQRRIMEPVLCNIKKLMSVALLIVDEIYAYTAIEWLGQRAMSLGVPLMQNWQTCHAPEIEPRRTQRL